MANFWDNRAQFNGIWIQKGGAGNPWTLLDEAGAMLDAVTGGGQPVESQFGLDAYGNRAYLGARVTGDKERYETTVSIRPDVTRLVTQLKQLNCPFNLMDAQRCGDLDLLNYLTTIIFYDGHVTSTSWDNALAQLMEGEKVDMMYQWDTSLAPMVDVMPKLKTVDLSGTVSDVAINKVISVGRERCIGPCDTAGSDGAQDFWAVTDADATPGYQAIATAMFLYTQDGGSTWNASYINSAPNESAFSVVQVSIGGKIAALVATSSGVNYAIFDDIKNGVVNPWTKVTTGFTGPNYPNALFAVSSTVVYAAANGGYTYKSTDAGLSWTALTSGNLTAQNLTHVAFADSTTGYFAGAGGALLQYYNGTMSQITIRTSVGGAAVTANLTALAVRPGNGNHVFVGTATGLVYATLNANGSYPLFESRTFPNSGNGSVDDMQFTGYDGAKLFLLQSNSTGESRILRDVSGGYLRTQVEIVSDFTAPGNFNLNSIAPANINTAIAVGEVHDTYAAIFKATAA